MSRTQISSSLELITVHGMVSSAKDAIRIIAAHARLETDAEAARLCERLTSAASPQEVRDAVEDFRHWAEEQGLLLVYPTS